MNDGPAAALTPGRAIGQALGVILAGGQSHRMDGIDKGLVVLQGKPLIRHAIDRLARQVDRLIINANGDPARYAALDIPVVADTLDGHPGPLAGLLAAMRWTERHAPDVTHVATAPVDTPFFPSDLVGRLRAAIAVMPGAELAFATTADGPQPVFALVSVALADRLQHDIAAGNARRVIDWLRGHAPAEVPFADSDAFFNVNTPTDLAAAERMAAARVIPPCR